MSTDPTFERQAILSRARAYLLGGRVYDSIPDDQRVIRDENGRPRPYAVVHYGTVYRLGTSRSLVGEEEQPHVLPITILVYAAQIESARVSAGAVRDLFVGWHASPGSDEITNPGGTAYRDRDAAGTPTLYVEAVALECVFNLGSNDGAVPSPGDGPDGAAQIDTIESIVRAILAEQPGPNVQRYDFVTPVGQWSAAHTLGRVPSVEAFSLTGERFLPDIVATPTQVTATFAAATPGFLIPT